MTPERIARLWAAVCEGDAARARVMVCEARPWCPNGALVLLRCAYVVTPYEHWREGRAYGRTDDEALAALDAHARAHGQPEGAPT